MSMSVTEETSQEERSPLNKVAPENMLVMSVTEETSQEERSPWKKAASRNMLVASVTRLRLGTSVARYSILVAPEKASRMEDQDALPH